MIAWVVGIILLLIAIRVLQFMYVIWSAIFGCADWGATFGYLLGCRKSRVIVIKGGEPWKKR